VQIAVRSPFKTFKTNPTHTNSGIRTQSSQIIEQTSSRNSENRTIQEVEIKVPEFSDLR